MPNHLEELIGKKTGDSGWASNFSNFGGDRETYDKYFEDGKLKEGYSLSGDIGGSEQVFENSVRGEMAGTKDARYRKEDKTFEIYKLPDQKAAPAPAPQPKPKPKPEAKKPEPKKPEPVEHSPEIQQAKERVNKYKQNLVSSDTSDRIYGKSNAGFLDKYKMNLNN